MRMRNWFSCVLLAALAFAACYYLGVDLRHTIAITLAAFAAGGAYVLLESLSGEPSMPEPEKVRTPRGLDDVQALAFSLSVNGGRSGNRARMLLADVGNRALEQDGEDHSANQVGSSLAAALNRTITDQDLPRGTIPAAVKELEHYLSRSHHLPPARTPEAP